MGQYFKLIAGSLFFILLFSDTSYALDTDKSIGAERMVYSDTGDVEINLFLALFAGELSRDAQSVRCTEMYNYLLNFVATRPGLSPYLFASINRYIGAYNYYNGEYSDAEQYYRIALESYQLSENPDTAGLCTVISQLGLSIYGLDRYVEAADYLKRSIKLREQFYGDSSPYIINPLTSLSAVYIDMGEYDRARESALRAIEIVGKSGSGSSSLGLLYYNLGVYYGARGDYNNARSMYQVAESRQIEYDHNDLNMLLNIFNGLSVANTMTGDTLNAINSYENMVELLESMKDSPPGGAVYYTNYGHFLSRIGRYEESLEIFNKAVKYCYDNYGTDSERYLSARENLASYYSLYTNDISSAYNIYSDLLIKTNKGRYAIALVNDIKRGLANVLVEKGELDPALSLYNEVLGSGEYISPPMLLFTYSFRSNIYIEKYLQDKSIEYLDIALQDIDAAISILDSVKIDLSGEESRLQITGRFDFLWDNAIWLASEKYKYDNDPAYLNLAFRYSEKSKASTLLSSTREVQAMEFHVPEDLVGIEKELDHYIKKLTDNIYTETNSGNADSALINLYEEERTGAVIKRDSLIRLFERDYPRYYKLKHEDKVAYCKDVRNYLGRDKNFVEFFMSDSILYTFIFNRKGCELLNTSIDSVTRNIVGEFRSDITNPAIETGARSQFKRIVKNGHYLHKLLIEPIKPYLISKNLIIASDDILSYIPFEALISDTTGVRPINYRDIDFLFKEFEIIYTYSATLLIESEGKGKSFLNPALVFAPTYSSTLDSDSLLLSRQMERGPLNNIPGAKEEAIYISSLLGGQLYLENQASEQRFVSEASSEKIIHLAMHTLLNDRQPMLSKMVFAQNNDTIENGLLNTYEIYNLDLNAKMVVLSSCNTGSGYLQSGEGIISLARGFMYAGSPSVVMSLWEVDDYSASEIIKSFYSNLKNGYSKSGALKKSRKKYLRSADQLRSHPYFWCSLVILGEDEPIFYKRHTIGLTILVLLSLIYVRRRYYKPKSS